jgi:DNA-binding transcriptional MocR family regulator
LVLGVIASFKNGWISRRAIARHLRISVRTVQRAISEAKSLGLLGVARFKPNEVPPGAKAPITCGGSHRWTIGWGLAGKAVQNAIAKARARWLSRAAAAATALAFGATSPGPAGSPRLRSWEVERVDGRALVSRPEPKRFNTAAKIEAEELERRTRTRDGPE